VICEPISQCYEAGQCVFPGDCTEGLPKADGTTCDDLNPNTEGDQCIAGTCTGTPVAIEEVCDGLDNDLDGTIDEDWPDIGDACAYCYGEYPCIKQCDPNNLTGPTVCDAAPDFWGCDPNYPAEEVCDGLDNDCNGPADDGYLWDDLGEACSAGGSQGIKQCDPANPTGPTVCSAVPPPV
jgi:hypothetical protein